MKKTVTYFDKNRHIQRIATIENSFIAFTDGYIQFRPDGQPDLIMIAVEDVISIQ